MENKDEEIEKKEEVVQDTSNDNVETNTEKY